MRPAMSSLKRPLTGTGRKSIKHNQTPDQPGPGRPGVDKRGKPGFRIKEKTVKRPLSHRFPGVGANLVFALFIFYSTGVPPVSSPPCGVRYSVACPRTGIDIRYFPLFFLPLGIEPVGWALAHQSSSLCHGRLAQPRPHLSPYRPNRIEPRWIKRQTKRYGFLKTSRQEARKSA